MTAAALLLSLTISQPAPDSARLSTEQAAVLLDGMFVRIEGTVRELERAESEQRLAQAKRLLEQLSPMIGLAKIAARSAAALQAIAPGEQDRLARHESMKIRICAQKIGALFLESRGAPSQPRPCYPAGPYGGRVVQRPEGGLMDWDGGDDLFGFGLAGPDQGQWSR